MQPTLINMSLAQSVANAVKFPPLIPPHVVRATGKKDKSGSNGSGASVASPVVKNKQSNNNQQHQQHVSILLSVDHKSLTVHP